MNPNQINWLAVLAAALSAFVVGGLWYSPILFGKVWLKANGFTEAQAQSFSRARAFGGAFVLALIMSANLAMFLADPTTTVLWGMTAGALAGIGWAAAGLAVVALFENRSWTYILVNGGYLAVSFVLMGAILGAWR
jgi:Protein of unknown function (DUF1761)